MPEELKPIISKDQIWFSFAEKSKDDIEDLQRKWLENV
jgi:hypothetical protein